MAATTSKDCMVWVDSSGGENVEDAIIAGTSSDGNDVCIIRAKVGDELAIGKLQNGQENGHIPYNGGEESVTDYQVLINPGNVELEWVSASDGDVPLGGVVGGTDAEGGPMFIVRCSHEDQTIPGKLVIPFKTAYIPWGGSEHAYTEYEVLCVKFVKPRSRS